jgi:hypothetical protein
VRRAEQAQRFPPYKYALQPLQIRLTALPPIDYRAGPTFIVALDLAFVVYCREVGGKSIFRIFKFIQKIAHLFINFALTRALIFVEKNE